MCVCVCVCVYVGRMSHQRVWENVGDQLVGFDLQRLGFSVGLSFGFSLGFSLGLGTNLWG